MTNCNKIDFTVCIVCYNNELTINKCISSVELFLKNYSFEILVFDNMSSDDSVNKLEKISSVKLFKSTINYGFSKACNFLATHSKSENLVFMNPDLFIKKNFFLSSETFNCLKKHDALTFSGDNSDLELENKNINLYPGLLKIKNLFLKNYKINFKKCYVDGSFLIIKKKIFLSLDGFENYFLYGEDMFFMYKFSLKGYKLKYLDHKVLSHQRGHSSGKVKHKFLINKIYPEFIFVSKYCNFFERFLFQVLRSFIVFTVLIFDLFKQKITIDLFFFSIRKILKFNFLTFFVPKKWSDNDFHILDEVHNYI